MRKIDKGFFFIPRKVFDESSSIYKWPPAHFKLWMWMIGKANHANKIVEGQQFKRGELLTTYRELQSCLSYRIGYRMKNCSKSTIEGIIKKMKKSEMITTRKTTIGMFITIQKYDFYQTASNYEDHKEDDNGTTYTIQKPDSINKNEKNLEEIKNKYIGTQPKSDNKSSKMEPIRNIIYPWQDEAKRFAEKLQINLTQEYEDRWYSIFKKAHESNQRPAIQKAYGLLYDYPDTLSNEARIKYFFKIYNDAISK